MGTEWIKELLQYTDSVPEEVKQVVSSGDEVLFHSLSSYCRQDVQQLCVSVGDVSAVGCNGNVSSPEGVRQGVAKANSWKEGTVQQYLKGCSSSVAP